MCVCGPVAGGQPPCRRHHFWDCPVAQAVVGVLQQQLAGWFSDALQPQHVLCMVCPVVVGVAGAPALHKGVWRVVCLAAINTMDEGRVAANKLNVQRREEQQAAADAAWLDAALVPAGQQLISALLQPAPLTPAQQQHRDRVRQQQQLQQQQRQQEQQQAAAARLVAVQRHAVSRFWELLQDFVALRVAPRAWLPQLAPDHPFLRVDGDLMGVHCAVVAPGAG